MTKDETVAVMTEVVNKLNRERAWSNGIPSDQVDQALEHMQEELKTVNALIYDKLDELGLFIKY